MRRSVFLTLVVLAVGNINAIPVKPASRSTALVTKDADSATALSQKDAAAVNASACIYREAVASGLVAIVFEVSTSLTQICDGILAAGWTLRDQYKATQAFNLSYGHLIDEDDAYLYTEASTGACLLAFRGSDLEIEMNGLNDPADYATMYGTSELYMDYHGKSMNVAAVKELESVLAVISAKHGSLAAAFSSCSELTVTGHSFGGVLASLFAWLANVQSDPAGIGKRVSAVYPITPGVASGRLTAQGTTLTNDQTTDGCFPGATYYTSITSSEIGTITDLTAFNTGATVKGGYQLLPIDGSEWTPENPGGVVGQSYACSSGLPFGGGDGINSYESLHGWIMHFGGNQLSLLTNIHDFRKFASIVSAGTLRDGACS